MTTVASPCIHVCRMDQSTGLCLGCFRTLDEIVAWSGSSDAERRAVLDRVAHRRQEQDPGEKDLLCNGKDGER